MIDFFPRENCDAPSLRSRKGKVHAKLHHRGATMFTKAVYSRHIYSHTFLTYMIDSYIGSCIDTFGVIEQPFTSENGVVLCNIFRVIQQA